MVVNLQSRILAILTPEPLPMSAIRNIFPGYPDKLLELAVNRLTLLGRVTVTPSASGALIEATEAEVAS